MYEGQMITSGLNNSGDVVLAPEKKSHKKWIIIGVVALVLIVILVVAFLIPKGGVNISGGAKSAFNRYANYVLYGIDSTDQIGQYNEEMDYLLYDLSDMELSERKAYFAKAGELLDDFKEKNNGNSNYDFMNAFSNYLSDFELAKLVYTNTTLDSDTLVGSAYDNVRRYGEYQADYEELSEKYLNDARASGCPEMEDVHDGCGTYMNADMLTQIDDDYFEMIMLRDDAVTNTLVGCFNLSNMIYGITVEPVKEEGLGEPGEGEGSDFESGDSGTEEANET